METIGTVFGAISFVLIIIIIFKFIKMRKNNSGGKKPLIAMGTIAVVLFIIAALLIPSDETAEVVDGDNAGDNVDNEMINDDGVVDEIVDEVDMTDKESIRNVVEGVLGDKNNNKDVRVEDVNQYEYEDIAHIHLKLNANENMTINLTKKGILQDTLKVMSSLKDAGHEGSFSVLWQLPLTDKYGNESLGKVMSIDISAEDFNAINYDNYDYNNLPSLSEQYWEHPSFK